MTNKMTNFPEIKKISLESKRTAFWDSDRASLWLHNINKSQEMIPHVRGLIDSGCDLVLVSGENAADVHDTIDDICMDIGKNDILTAWNTKGLEEAAFNLIVLRGKPGTRALLLAVNDMTCKESQFVLQEMQLTIEQNIAEHF